LSLLRWLLIAAICCHCLWLGGCSDPAAAPQAHYSSADFVGDWETVLPNGDRWRMILTEDGRFRARPVHGFTPPTEGSWELVESALQWGYPEPSAAGGVKKEINPIILKTANKFMLQERRGMKSVFVRHVK